MFIWMFLLCQCASRNMLKIFSNYIKATFKAESQLEVLDNRDKQRKDRKQVVNNSQNPRHTALTIYSEEDDDVPSEKPEKSFPPKFLGDSPGSNEKEVHMEVINYKIPYLRRLYH